MRNIPRREFLVGTGAALAAARAAMGAAGAPPLDAAVTASARYPAVHDLMAAQVASGKIPGAVWLVAEGPIANVDAIGVTGIGSKSPMRRDTIFRIASMSKAVTATAVMMLIEQGTLSLDAPVERWLPELAKRRVLKRIDGPLNETVPAKRPILVRDLLSFTLGFGILFDNNLPIQKQIDALQLMNGPPVPMTPHAPDEWLRRFGTLPLMHQPGERWMYNTGSLLQGVLVARAAKQDFDAFVNQQIIAPLGMRDTGFFVPAHKLDRFAGCGVYTDQQTGKEARMDGDGAQSAYATRPVFPSGAAGLVSTIDDYLIFARMLFAGGAHKGRRMLSADSVRLMTTNQLSPQQIAASEFFPHFFDAHGWGYGMSVIVQPDAVSQTPGRYGWDGGFGTSWINDPTRGIISIVMTQSTDFLFSGALDSFWKGVYGGLEARA